MASSKWFDLRTNNATLERLKSDADGVFLKLTVKSPAEFEEKADAIVAAGWVASTSDPNAFINRERMVAMSEIKKSLLAFFSDEQIALTDISKLPGNIYVGGFERGKPVEPETLRPNIIGLNEHTQSEILKRVASAAALAGVGAKLSVPFGGQLLERWEDYIMRMGSETTGAIIVAIKEFQRGNSENAAIIEKILAEAHFKEDYRDLQRSIPKSLSSAIATENKNVRNIASAIARLLPGPDNDFGNLMKAHATILMNSLKNIPVTFLDRKFFENKTSAHALPEKIGTVSLRYETGLPTELKWQSARRIEAALEAVKAVFGAPTGHIFGPIPTSVMITRTGLNEEYNGLHRLQTWNDISVGQICYSPYSGHSLIHEIGHAVDYGHMKDLLNNSYREQKYKKIIYETGVGDAAASLVGAAEAAGLKLSEQYKNYLLLPEEIFARTFKAVMVQSCFDQGDNRLAAIGGGLLETMDFVSDDPALLHNFVNAVKKWNLEYSMDHANDKRAEREGERSSDIMAL